MKFFRPVIAKKSKSGVGEIKKDIDVVDQVVESGVVSEEAVTETVVVDENVVLGVNKESGKPSVVKRFMLKPNVKNALRTTVSSQEGSKYAAEVEDVKNTSFCSSTVEIDLDSDLFSPKSGKPLAEENDNDDTVSIVSSRPSVSLFERKTACRARVPVKFKHSGDLSKKTMLMRDLVYWNPADQPATQWRQDRDRKRRADKIKTDSDQETEAELPAAKKMRSDPAQSSSASAPHIPAPQVKLDAHGNIVLNEESLIIRDQFADPIQEVTETLGDLKADYNAFRRKPCVPKKQWSVRETIRFYKALSTIGTDFTYMNSLFKNRTREELKRKFKREEKANPHLMDRVLKARRSYDLSIFDPSSDESDTDNPVPELVVKKRVRKLERPKLVAPPTTQSLDIVIDAVVQNMIKETTPTSTCATVSSRHSDQFVTDNSATVSISSSNGVSYTIHRLYKTDSKR